MCACERLRPFTHSDGVDVAAAVVVVVLLLATFSKDISQIGKVNKEDSNNNIQCFNNFFFE